MPCLRMFGVLVLAAWPAVAGAQDTTQSTGIPACDAFLAAYARCAASPGVPDAARPGIRQGIERMRSSYREVVAGSPAAVPGLAASCASTHRSVRQSMVGAFKCDFPEPTAVADTAPSPGPAPHRPSASPEQQEVAKANAWVEAQNYLVEWYHLNQDLSEYQQAYARDVPRAGARPGRNAAYYFAIKDFDGLLERLHKAQDMPGTVPGVDEAGARLIAALEPLNPVVKRLTRYRTTQEYQEDGFKLAREQNDAVVTGMKASAKAAALFSAALGEREVARDEKRLDTLPEGSLPLLLLRASLDARRVLAQQDLLEPRGDTKQMAAAVAALAQSNGTLHDKLDGASPKPSSYCTGYAEYLDEVVGGGRGVVRDLGTGGNPANDARSVVNAYNKSVDYLQNCRKDLAQAD